MPDNNYLNLFLDAGISDRRDQEKYSRCLDAVLAQEGITVGEIIGVGEKGTGGNPVLYVICRQAIADVWEGGVFHKRIEVERICPIASIGRLSGAQEGFKGTDLTMTGHTVSGEVLFRIVWGLGGPDWVEPLVQRQRAHLFKLISDAMDSIAEPPARPSVSATSSKAQTLMDWAADVVKAAGVPATDAIVTEHAGMIAAVIRMLVFLPLGGIDDLNKFYPSGEMPSGSILETFDDLYQHVVERVGSAQTVDRAIDERLAGAWFDYVNGCAEAYR